jgi:CBS domain-containing protein
MSVASLCSRDVAVVSGGDGVVSAAQIMREQHVGYLVVTDPKRGGAAAPVGVITDRDIVIAVVASEVDPRSLTVGDAMTRQPLVLQERSSVEDALVQMRQIGVRRAPVVDASGGLIGVLSVDDVLDELAGKLMSIAACIRNEQRIERLVRT